MSSLNEAETESDPFRQFARWFDEARAREPEPTAMALATTTRDGRPSSRMVLLKGVDERGFVFYTNYRSRKGREIGETRRASLLFYWPSLHREVRIEGTVERVSDAESDAYFATRPPESRWSAVVSPQSEVIGARTELETAVADVKARFGDAVPRPAWWGGYRVLPDAIEFWQGRPNRLHDRLLYRRGLSPVPGETGTAASTKDGWRIERLAP